MSRTREQRTTAKVASVQYCIGAWAEAIDHEDHHTAWSYVEDIARSVVGARAVTVEAMRAAGRSWEDVGDVIGVSKQAAWEQYRYVDAILAEHDGDEGPEAVVMEVSEDDGTTTVS